MILLACFPVDELSAVPTPDRPYNVHKNDWHDLSHTPFPDNTNPTPFNCHGNYSWLETKHCTPRDYVVGLTFIPFIHAMNKDRDPW